AGRDPGPGQRRPGAACRNRRAHAPQRHGGGARRCPGPGRAARRLPPGPPTGLRRSHPMKLLPTGSLLLGLLWLAGCASAPPSADNGTEATLVAGTAADAAPAPTLPAADTPAPASAADPAADGFAVGDGPDAVAPPVADTASMDEAGLAPTEAEDDFAALYGTTVDDVSGQSPAYDPWEPMNRRVHAFNVVVDRAIARPIARAYVAVVPEPVRLGVGNF